jgi:hypothetical protein
VGSSRGGAVVVARDSRFDCERDLEREAEEGLARLGSEARVDEDGWKICEVDADRDMLGTGGGSNGGSGAGGNEVRAPLDKLPLALERVIKSNEFEPVVSLRFGRSDILDFSPDVSGSMENDGTRACVFVKLYIPGG